jgi:hypothetical protein
LVFIASQVIAPVALRQASAAPDVGGGVSSTLSLGASVLLSFDEWNGRIGQFAFYF